MTKNDFIAKAITELLEDGFSIRLPMVKSIDGKYGGWFSHLKSEREFVVAMKRDSSFEVFVHEYCHYLQWKYHRRFFTKKVKGCDIVFSWLEGKRFSKKIIKQAIHDTIELEWHCEQLVYELISRYNLDIDRENYARGANCYLFFYHTVHKLRAWCTKDRSPYSSALRKLAPDKIHALDFYLNQVNYNNRLRTRHEKICSL